MAFAGYGSFNNYLYCEEHGMEKNMKFTMFEKESKDEKYRDNPYRAVNFPINKNGKPVCPNGKEFNFLYTRPVKGNKYGTEAHGFRMQSVNQRNERVPK